MNTTWKRRCRCGEPAKHELVYEWAGKENRRADVCDQHYHATLDSFEALKQSAPHAVRGLRILVTA